ncbi:MAG: Eco57I restriction-modification methylase domain-containing protein, partial [Candidatus Hermodarchaeota archaeon]
MKSFNRKYNSLLEQITNYLIERGLINDISTDFSRNLIKRSFLLAFLTLIRSQLNPVKLSLEDYSCLFSNKKGHSSLKNKNELSIVIETLLPFDWGLTNVIEQQDKEFIQKKLKEFIDTFNWQPIHPINYDISENIITPQIFETIFNLESSKKRGAVNTPYYLAYWIVKSNFQKLFSNFLGMSNFSLDVLKSLDAESKKVFKDWMVKLKVLDIAVGCGTFFLAAGRYIINLFKYLGLPPVFFAKILYGVDIDKKAIQICRIRLFLLILYSVPSIQLKDLMKIIESSKLKSGNSLIGSVKKSIDRENIESEIEEIMKKSSHLIHFNIFHWYLEFPEIFQRSKEIGFDMVIG